MDGSRNLTPTQVTEVEICRSNLFSVFRMAIKSVIDIYFVNKLTEQSPELHNLLVIFEKLITFDFKPSPKYPTVWCFMKNSDSVLCKFARHRNSQNQPDGSKTRSDENCCEIFDQVISLDTKQTTDQGRVRAWARLCLMHKRFSHHFRMFCARSDEVLRTFYGSLSMFYMRDQMAILCDDLVGLNALDFTFQLKDEPFRDYVFVIDYSPYLNFSQCAESRRVDDLELQRLQMLSEDTDLNRNSVLSDSLSEDISQADYEDDNLLDPETFFGPDPQKTSENPSNGVPSKSLGINLRLHSDMESPPTITNDELHTSKTLRVASPRPPSNGGSGAISRSTSAISLNSSVFTELVNQKSFLEEVLSQKTNQVEVLKAENERLKHLVKMAENSTNTERQEYEAIILELQDQLSSIHDFYLKTRKQNGVATVSNGSSVKIDGAIPEVVVGSKSGKSNQSSSNSSTSKSMSKGKSSHPL